MELPNWFVCLMGIGIVFIGLVSIILICMLMSFIVRKLEKPAAQKSDVAPVPVTAKAEIPNRQEFVAAVSAALAEDMGKDISAIRILSIKKI